MEATHKIFKPFDKVIVKINRDIWHVDLYSAWNEKMGGHQTLRANNGCSIHDKWILPYEGNEHLVGTSDDPDEEVKLVDGEWMLASLSTNRSLTDPVNYTVIRFWELDIDDFDDTRFKDDRGCFWDYVIKFADFNPDDMEKTSKNILHIKNGRVVRYKPE